jgi:hypothetical protein
MSGVHMILMPFRIDELGSLSKVEHSRKEEQPI